MLTPKFDKYGPTPCSKVDDPDMFTPDMDVPGSLAKANQAKKICATCPYLAECLAYAMSTPQEGIWGGTSANERRKMKRNLGRARYSDYTTYLLPLPPRDANSVGSEVQRVG